MSLEDRDWYRDLLRQRAGMKPKWNLWRAKRPLMHDGRPNPLYVRPHRPWHPVLMVMVWAVVFLVIFIVSKKIVS